MPTSTRSLGMAFSLFNFRFILLISASFITIFSSIAIYFCLPLFISHLARTQITLSPTSGSFENWRLNSLIDQIYLYNITNLHDVIASGSESLSSNRRPSRQIPNFHQVGPFSFRHEREKINIKFDQSNETVVYNQIRRWTFLPDLSLVKSTDEMAALWINHISVPLAGATLNAEFGEFIDPIVQENDLKLFLEHSVNTLLFEGYFDILMEQAKASGQVDVDKFGWMHNQNNSISQDIRVFTGPSNATMHRFGSVDQMDHKRQFYTWHRNGSEPKDFTNVSCNEFRYSSAGEFFPPSEHSLISHNYYYQHSQEQDTAINPEDELEQQAAASISKSESHSVPTNDSKSDAKKFERYRSKIGKSISLFMPDLCRTIQLYYHGSYYYRELLVDRYMASKYTYVYESPGEDNQKVSNFTSKLIDSNKCYCVYNENTKTTSCPPNGIMDLFNCRKGSSLGISFPHFLYSTKDQSLQPNLRLFTDSVGPNDEDHQFFMDLEATLNLPVNVQIVYQFNVHIRNDQSMNSTKEYAYLFQDPSDSRKEPLKDVYFPQMWIKSISQVDEPILRNLLFIQKYLHLVTPITTMIIFGVGSILLLASAKLAYDLTSSRKSISCDHESCSSLDGNHQCAYMDQKKKFLDLHLLANEKAYSLITSPNMSSSSNENEQAHSSTTKKANNFVITTSSLGAGRAADAEGLPLNR